VARRLPASVSGSATPSTPTLARDARPRLLWQAELNGCERVDLWNYWPGCARRSISREEYDRIAKRNATMDEESPFYDPRRPVDLFTAPPPAF
jgi:hypothetical protein